MYETVIFAFSLFVLTDGSVWFGWKYVHQECSDVAIVGGGIGGTYTAWRLRDKGLKVDIFENSNRIGGRLYSVFLPSIPNVPAEMGAMRYIPGTHKTLESLLPKLGLQSDVFHPDQFDKIYYFRGTRLTSKELESPKLPYNLASGESRNVDELLWNASQRAVNMTEPDKIPDIEEAVTPDGIPLYQQGYTNILGKVASMEAREYIVSMMGFDTIYGRNNNAIPCIIAENPSKPRKVRRTVVGGMNLVSKRLAEQFTSASNRHTINLNRRVHSMRKVWYKGRHVYQLTVYETETVNGITTGKREKPYRVCAHQVVLAVSQHALRNIYWYPLQHDPDLLKALDSITDYRAMKIFLAYPSAWWDNLSVNGRAFVTDLPLRQGGEFGRFRNSEGDEIAMMLVSYNDGKVSSDYWRELRKLGNNISSSTVPVTLSVSSEVVDHVHRYLAEIYGVHQSSIPWPLDGVMTIWDESMNSRAWATFKTGYKPKNIAKIVRQPSLSHRVFIVTNAFDMFFASWIEGCLKSADDILGNLLSFT